MTGPRHFDDPEALQIAAKRALAGRAELASETQKSLRNAFRAVRIHGYRDASLAPPKLLQDALVGLARRDPSFSEFLVWTWKDLSWDWLEPIYEAAKPEELKPVLSGSLSDEKGARRDEIGKAVRALELRVKAARESASDKEAELAAYALLLTAIEERDDGAAKAALPPRFETLLAELADLAADAPEWEALPRLIKRLNALGEKKAEEFASVEKRRPLRDALAGLAELKPALEGLGLDVSAWSADACSEEAIESAVAKVGEFIAHVKATEELSAKLDNTIPLGERLKTAARVTEEWDKAQEAYAELGKLLAPHPDTSPEPSGGEAPPSAPVEPFKEPVAPADAHPAAPAEAAPDSEGSATGKDDIVAPTVEDLEPPPAVAETVAEPLGEERVPEQATSGAPEPAAPPAPLPEPTDAIEEPTNPATAESEGKPHEVEPAGSELAEPKTDEPIEVVPRRAPARSAGATAVWRAIASGDLSAACWLGRAYRDESPFPDWLLAVCAASGWLRGGASRLETDVLAIVQAHEQPPDNPQAQALAVSAALLPSLIAPTAGLMAWLHPLPDPYQSANRVIDAVQRFAEYGYAFEPAAINDLLDRDASDRVARECASDVHEWVEQYQAFQRNFLYPQAGDTFRLMLRGEGPLARAIFLATDDRRGEAETVDVLLRQLDSRDGRDEQIRRAEDELAEQHRHPRFKRTTGMALDQLHNVVEDTVGLARAWVLAARRWGAISKRGAWLQDLVGDFAEGIRENAPSAIAELDRLASEGGDEDRDTMARRLSEVVKELAAYSRGEPLPRLAPPTVQTGLEAGLSFRLLLTEGADLSEAVDGSPQPSDLGGRAWREVLARPPLSAEQALEYSITSRDFRWTEALSAACSDVARAEEMLRGALMPEKERLGELVADVTRSLEGAFVEGTVSEDLRTEIAAEMQSMLKAVDDGRASFRSLERRVVAARERIGASRQEVLADRSHEWESLASRLQTLLDGDQYGHVESAVREALRRQNVYHADIILDAIRHALRSDPKDVHPTIAQVIPTEREQSLDDFLAQFHRDRDSIADLFSGPPSTAMHISHLARLVKDNRAPEALRLAGMTPPRRAEIQTAFAAWHELREAGGKYRVGLESYVSTVLSYLGYRVRPQSVEKLDVGKDWLLWRAGVAAVESSPVPQFGSGLAGGLPVLCLWERPGATVVDSMIREARIERRPMLVLYLGRLSTNQRLALRRNAVRTELECLVLDELLLIFLARYYEGRLQAFYQCALAYAYVNPYVAGTALAVPQEMFFGRHDLLRELDQPSGTSLIYGGRQLGKSSVLRHLQRSFHRPDRDQYAFYEDIKTVVSPASIGGPEAIWGTIARGLVRVELADNRLGTDPTEVEAAIRRVMAPASRRLLVLFDEADDFFEADAANRFRVVSRLKALMDDTGRRFKIVFAGLHNVQRFASIPNQPLAHLGIPAVVGPLEAPAARELVERPMFALGLRFRDRAVPLTILSLTNYHPGLIQHFCKQLAKSLLRDRNVTLPHEVTVEEVQAVYRDQILRQDIRSKFLLTLSIDERYGVLVKSMILDQMEQRNGFSRTYPLQTLGELGAKWWPEGFSALSEEQLRGYVRELVDFWALAPAGPNRYRLRSPNVVRLLGTAEEIRSDLSIYRKDNPKPREDPWRNPDSLHERPPDRPAAYSPLTQGQFRRLGLGKGSVTLVFGSAATGLDEVAAAIEYACRVMGLSYHRGSLPVDLPSSGSTRRTAARRARQLAAPGAVAVVDVMPGGAARIVLDALDAASRPATGALDVVLLVCPAAAVEWLKLPSAERADLEASCGALVLATWSETAITRWLDETGLLNSGVTSKTVLGATGGYHVNLKQLQATWLASPGSDGAAVVRAFGEQLMDPASEVARAFAESFELGEVAGRIAPAAPLILSGVEDAEALSYYVSEALQVGDEEAACLVRLLEGAGLFERTDDGDLRANAVAARVLASRWVKP